MTAVLPIPSRKDERWRYADLAAVARLGPLPAPERIEVVAGVPSEVVVIVGDGDARDTVRQLVIDVPADAAAHVFVLLAGGDYARVSIDVTLGRGAQFTLGGTIIAHETQTMEIVTNVVHAEPDAISRQTVRAIAGGRATASFLGKVGVLPDAQRTDSSQSFRAMLLDRTATVNAKPELEILADDVKCAHGAAIGELDPAALFYLQSRGLSPADAKRVLLQSFVAESFDGATAADTLRAAALAALEAIV